MFEYLPYEFIQIKNVEVIKSFLSVPPSEYIQEISNFITAVSSSASKIYLQTTKLVSFTSNI
jgi:hypothetical protein